MRPDQGALRLVRALALSSAVLGLGAGGHALAGGPVPTLGSLGVLVLVLLPFTLIATRVQLRPWPTLAGLGAGQVLSHFALSSPEAGGGGSCAAGAHAAHRVSALSADCLSAVSGHQAHAASGLFSPSMLLAHLVAAALTAWLLAHGEEVLWRAVSWLLPRVPSLQSAAFITRPRTLGAAVWSPRGLSSWSPLKGRAPPQVA